MCSDLMRWLSLGRCRTFSQASFTPCEVKEHQASEGGRGKRRLYNVKFQHQPMTCDHVQENWAQCGPQKFFFLLHLHVCR